MKLVSNPTLTQTFGALQLDTYHGREANVKIIECRKWTACRNMRPVTENSHSDKQNSLDY